MDTHNIDELQRHHAKWKRSQTQKDTHEEDSQDISVKKKI